MWRPETEAVWSDAATGGPTGLLVTVGMVGDPLLGTKAVAREV